MHAACTCLISQPPPAAPALQCASEKEGVAARALFAAGLGPDDRASGPLGASEPLLATFSCALQQQILVQGRLFVFDRHVGFYSNILGCARRPCGGEGPWDWPVLGSTYSMM